MVSDLLQDGREAIDEIDRQMARLFEQRMEAAAGIARYKWERKIPVFDPAREERMLKHAAFPKKRELAPYYEKYLHYLMKLSKDYQGELLSRFEAEGGDKI